MRDAEVVSSVGLQRAFTQGFSADGFILERLEGKGTPGRARREIVSSGLQAAKALLPHPGRVGVLEGPVSFRITRVPDIATTLSGEDGFHLVAPEAPGACGCEPPPIPARALAPYPE